jgi:hypothetical protein
MCLMSCNTTLALIQRRVPDPAKPHVLIRRHAMDDGSWGRLVRRARKRPGPLRVVDLVAGVAAQCPLWQTSPCPCRPTIDRRLERDSGIKVHRRGVAVPGTAGQKISPGTFIVGSNV